MFHAAEPLGEGMAVPPKEVVVLETPEQIRLQACALAALIEARRQDRSAPTCTVRGVAPQRPLEKLSSDFMALSVADARSLSRRGAQ